MKIIFPSPNTPAQPSQLARTDNLTASGEASTGSSQAPMVSVIIVSWNARAYLEQCLTSLSEEACRYPMEVIVVDNASIDGSRECVRDKFPQVHLISNESNLGFAKGNNLAISASRGRYVCLINSDVKLIGDCITRLVDYCEAHPQVGMAGPLVFGGDGKLQRSCRGFPGLWNMFSRALALDTFFPRVRAFCGYSLSFWSQDMEAEVDILSGCFLLVRREAFSQVGLLDEGFFMYGEDMDWCRRFWSRRWKLAFVPSAKTIHYGGGSSANAPVRFHFEQLRADLQYWRKHHPPAAVACFFLIATLHQLLRACGFLAALGFGGASRKTYRLKLQGSVACLVWMYTGRLPVEVANARKNTRGSQKFPSACQPKAETHI